MVAVALELLVVVVVVETPLEAKARAVLAQQVFLVHLEPLKP
jgi:hypothetical protein